MAAGPMMNGEIRMSDRARRYLEAHADKAEARAPTAPVHRPAVRGDLYPLAPARGFVEAVLVCLSKYATFSGRASRSEYWYFFLFQALASLAAVAIDLRYFTADLVQDQSGPAGTVTALALFLPFLAVSWRRLHDTGRSGWWIGGFWLFLAGGMGLAFGALVTGGGGGAVLGLTLILGAGSLIYGVLMLVFLCTRGDPGRNRFG